ncbi:DUF4860 domain-containing protein [Clostridiaceae bacterium OttesenSCG-928-D20]|nr:DUF4860 domain-containing protein [Clostridiaceae bacterium OttesenSCG-928-D20]
MRKTRSHSMDTIFVLSLFVVFAGAVLITLLMGARAYSAVREKGDDSYYSRTALSYIAEKIRHNDVYDGVIISEFAGIDALELRHDFDGESYSTYLYYYDGSICEILCETGLDLSEDAGTPIIEAKDVEFKRLSSRLFEIIYTAPDGKESRLRMSLRSEVS